MIKKHRLFIAIVIATMVMITNFYLECHYSSHPGNPYYEKNRIMNSYSGQGLNYLQVIYQVASEGEFQKIKAGSHFIVKRERALRIIAGAILGIVGGSLLTVFMFEIAYVISFAIIICGGLKLLEIILSKSSFARIQTALPWHFRGDFFDMHELISFPLGKELIANLIITAIIVDFLYTTAGWFVGGLVRMAWERLRRHEKKEAT